MPLGTSHIEEGLLQFEKDRLVLRLDGGGCWRLSADLAAYELVGRRVRVYGLRIGFDLLDLRNVERC
jgi:hypothetical protein